MSLLPKSGVDLIKEFEGCFLDAYPDPLTGNEPITIGWGSTKRLDGSNWKMGDLIAQDEADKLLLHQLETSYLPPLTKIPCWGELNDNQRGAILSFAYNLGANFYGTSSFRTITNVLKNKWWHLIRPAFLLYCNPGTSVEQGLRRRRAAEADLFLKDVN